MSDHEILIRCDCGADVAAVDLWLKRGADPVPKDGDVSRTYSIEDFEEGYFTFYGNVKPRTWRERVQTAWLMLRGRGDVFACLILNPTDVGRLRAFLNEIEPAAEKELKAAG